MRLGRHSDWQSLKWSNSPFENRSNNECPSFLFGHSDQSAYLIAPRFESYHSFSYHQRACWRDSSIVWSPRGHFGQPVVSSSPRLCRGLASGPISDTWRMPTWNDFGHDDVPDKSTCSNSRKSWCSYLYYPRVKPTLTYTTCKVWSSPSLSIVNIAMTTDRIIMPSCRREIECERDALVYQFIGQWLSIHLSDRLLADKRPFSNVWKYEKASNTDCSLRRESFEI